VKVGPFDRSVTGWASDSFGVNYRASLEKLTWYRSGTPSKHSDRPLPFFHLNTNLFPGSRRADVASLPMTRYVSDWDLDNARQNATNVAIERFWACVKSDADASMGVSLGERKQAYDMIVKRVTDFGNTWKMFRRANPGEIYRWARDKPASPAIWSKTQEFVERYGSPSRKVIRRKTKSLGPRERLRDASSLFLEWHFGWSPLLQDIYDAVEVLASSPETRQCSGTATRDAYYYDRSGDTWQTGERFQEAYARYSVRVKGTPIIENANYALLNQLGLANPATVVWELVPWSFVIDWFVPVGRFLSSFSLGYGWRVEGGSTTYKSSSTFVEEWVPKYPEGEPYFSGGEARSFTREEGLPIYRLIRPAFKGFSVTRGITAIALVLQQLPRGS